eukprot:Gregarina_sp_Pseudo_9__2526@NODE_27_length_5599_cov_16_826439_g25_i0_p2_GENE_NODE_27_length_5599_cov_16_826439_g25_i0NODE_27_length_5599_cov_16_826439_g25_i0_p2_ORF_typecomplete_len606_score103_90EFhand_13/PF17958_1/2_7e20EFhand_7/PF13499_6/3_4e10SPARC_Ca_bdg/PF10591_9/8_7e03SPARC_Ca_bdg/PF10591_9/1_4e02SPARC_Ca_bdg/PF10591_9/0_11EFhand_1/PF00036_32/0_0071EFhand_8/PF13833_6/4e02EFhand_8/PF13833_6/0_083EFhand_5/PF13202_6/3_8e03EFhand_5/PF13202_6/0_18_NODE_27_length_5599_cov_16_826439_g25_i0661883
MSVLSDKGTEPKRKLLATNLQNAFLDWLSLPDTCHQLDSILAAVLAENTQHDKRAASPSAVLEITPSTRLIERSRLLSPVSTDLDFVSSMDRLPPSPAPDIGSPQKMSSTVSEDVDAKPRDATAPPHQTSVLNIVDMGSSTESLKEGEIPRFWVPARSRRPPTVAPKDCWTDQVAEIHWGVFDPSGTRRLDDPSTIWIPFSTFEMKIVKEILKLSRYMACCILCMVNGDNLEEDLQKYVSASTPTPAANSTESADGSTLSPRSDAPAEAPVLSLAKWKEFWINKQLSIENDIWNFFVVAKEDVHDFIWGHNFQPFLNELLERHPGAEFLKPTPEFQKRYAETVVARILYDLDSVFDHRVTFNQLAKSSLAACWRLIDDETDFNTIREFFSYEHFYVAYCRFWALDIDHDFRLDKTDLVKYDNHAFSNLTLNRLFTEAGSVISDGHSISYEGFFYLLMHDEDKTTDRSIEFWFRLVDLDGDGVLRYHELAHFYSEQLVRLESRTMEAPAFDVILCQLNDMIRPEISCEFRLRDLKKQRRHAPLFFNTLLSLTKFLAWEHRDPFIQKTEFLEFPCYTEWDRFCHLEYEKLSAEDISEEVSVGEIGDF